MDKKPKKSSIIKVGRDSGSGKFTKVPRAAKSRSTHTIDKIAKRHERVLKRLAAK
ncbi:MAG: hypothetical protein KJZ80_14250 [Hyphomicrobiaceae bacterium]|nr:hypothetical protein [Hyphomicrobiaceae bacterium]